MKRLLIFCMLLIAAPASAELSLDRAWVEDVGGYRCSYALVSWENDTGKTFTKAVTVQAVAYDLGGKKINASQRSFFAHDLGPMPSGFKGTLKIPVELGVEAFGKMEVKIIASQ